MTDTVDDTTERAMALRDRAEDDPAKAAASVDELFNLVRTNADQARLDAAKALELVALSVPERLASEVDRLIEAIEGARQVFESRRLSSALIAVAREYPEQVADHLDAVERLIAADDPNRVLGGVGALNGIGEADPSPLRKHADRLAELAAHPDDDLRFYAVRGLEVLARTDPDAVEPHSEALRTALVSDPQTGKMAFYALSSLGREHQDVVEGLASAVVSGLDADDRGIRIAALQLLPAVAKTVDEREKKPLLAARDALIDCLRADHEGERRAAAVAITDIARENPEHLPPEGDARLADAYQRAVSTTGLDLPDLQQLLKRIERGATA